MNQNKALCFFCTPYDSDIHSKIESRIIQNEYRRGNVWGFRIIERREYSLQSVYIEKQTFIENVTDPFGNSTEFERVSYTQIFFQLSVSPPHLLICQPPRSYRKLINQLAQFTEYTIAIENRSIDLLAWIVALEEEEVKGVVTKATINPVNYDKSTSGKLSLSSLSDLRGKIVKILKGTSYTIKKLKIVFNDNYEFPDVELFSNGKVVFTHPVDLNKFNIFYDTFNELTKNVESRKVK